jgi:hypothetical protein
MVERIIEREEHIEGLKPMDKRFEVLFGHTNSRFDMMILLHARRSRRMF